LQSKQPAHHINLCKKVLLHNEINKKIRDYLFPAALIAPIFVIFDIVALKSLGFTAE
jgi:hypothetical protein